MSDSVWRNVVSNVGSSAKGTYKYWDDALNKTHGKCDELAKGARRSKLQKALGHLNSGASSTIDSYEDDVNDWLKDARATCLLGCQPMEQLWEVSGVARTGNRT